MAGRSSMINDAVWTLSMAQAISRAAKSVADRRDRRATQDSLLLYGLGFVGCSADGIAARRLTALAIATTLMLRMAAGQHRRRTGTMPGLGLVGTTVKLRKRQLSRVCIGTVVAMGCFALAVPAMAAVCATSSVVASGQPGYFRFVAARQARVAWTRKVERDQRLGWPYSRWSLAHDAKVTCRQIARRYRCVAVADPCRSGGGRTADTTRRGPA